MAEQTSAERFEAWFAEHDPRYQVRLPIEKHLARAAWDAATAAVKPDLNSVSMATYLAIRDERDALRQRIAELEGRLGIADRLGEMVRGIGNRRPGPGETLSETFPHGGACLGCRLEPQLAAYEAAKENKPAS